MEEPKKIIKEKNKQTKRGFVFTILTLVIIVFMIIELNIYFRTYELKLTNEPMKLRTQVMQDFIKAYSSMYFNETAYAFVYSALYKLNNDSVSNPPQQDALAELIWNITYTGKRTDINPQKQLISPSNTLSAYDSNLSSLSNAMNINLSVKYYNFSIAQTDYWTVQYNFTMNVSIYDNSSQTSVKFKEPISLNISIIGFQDPWLARMGFKNRSIIPADQEIISLRPYLILNGTRGRGWFYGEPIIVTSCPGDNFVFPSNFIENKTKIMVTNNAEVAISCGQLFGAVVIVDDSNADSNSFLGLDVPIFVNSSAGFSNIPSTPFLIVSDSDSEITDTGTGHYHYILNIENLRNAIEGGRYVPRSNANFGYLRRLTNNVTGVFDEWGIETFIFGTSSVIPPVSSTYSFVDLEYNKSIQGNLYKGLPACSFESICNYTKDHPNSTVPYPIRMSNTGGYNAAAYYLGQFNSSMKR